MGVYIKGLNKKDISDLRVHKYGGAYEFVEYEDIIEVKTPHGRLIDVTKIPYLECADPEVAELVGEAPTVIEEEVE